MQIVLYPIPDDLEQGINHGELSIVLTSKQKTGIPILDKNGNPQTSTVTRAAYLKQNNVLPGHVYTGHVYRQKTGPDILYLGQFTVTQYYNPYHGIAPTDNSNAFPEHYVYVKINDVTKALLAKSKDIPDFLTKYNHWDCSYGFPARCYDDYENFRDFPWNENENLRTNDRLRLCSLCPYTQPS